MNPYIYFLLGIHTTILTLSTKKLRLVLAAGIKKAQVEMQPIALKKVEITAGSPNQSKTKDAS